MAPHLNDNASSSPVSPAPVEDEEIDFGPLYAAPKKVYPQKVKGRLRSIKTAILIITLGFYYFMPFLRWDRGPNAPDQAILLDLSNNRFYFFFIEIWPQEVYYFTGLLVLAALTLFLMNAVAGRVWCGYLCPQTVWTDLFFGIERWVEGDRRERMKADEAGVWTAKRVGQKITKHFLWLMVAWWTGGAWVLYFSDAPTLVWQLLTFTAPLNAYMWIGILTATTYIFAGWMREQVCLYMCPWPRIQAALTDEHALNVTYRYDRGEPRMSVKSATKARSAGEPAGDCVDCDQCVAVCPTGVDIRHGSQLGCIQCGLCIDACNNVMEKIGRPGDLIDYDTDVNIRRRQQGKEPIYRLFRARTVVYVVMITAILGVMAATLAVRQFIGISALHDRNPLSVTLSDGSIRNGYTLRLINKRTEPRFFALTVERLPGATLEAIGIETQREGALLASVAPDTTRELRVYVVMPKGGSAEASQNVTFRLTDIARGETATVSDHFFAASNR
jgi:cytochrome c oxidase accessory protein FixG